MNLCSEGHEEVCYSTENCPACAANFELGKANEKIDVLKVQLHKYKLWFETLKNREEETKRN